jgi:hypothetical protein
MRLVLIHVSHGASIVPMVHSIAYQELDGILWDLYAFLVGEHFITVCLCEDVRPRLAIF